MSLLEELLEVESLQELGVQLDGRSVPPLRMTEKQFVQWCPEDVRAEWVNGEVVMMSPSNVEHVQLTLWLAHLLRSLIEHDDLGTLLATDAEVRLAKVPSRRLPDLFFIARARESIIKRTFTEGAPDLAIEIVSYDSESRDRREKFMEYEKERVREYWIVDPLSKTVEAYTLGRNGRYKLIPIKDGRIRSKVIKRFYLKPEWLFQSPLPKVAPILKQMGVK